MQPGNGILSLLERNVGSNRSFLISQELLARVLEQLSKVLFLEEPEVETPSWPAPCLPPQPAQAPKRYPAQAGGRLGPGTGTPPPQGSSGLVFARSISLQTSRLTPTRLSQARSFKPVLSGHPAGTETGVMMERMGTTDRLNPGWISRGSGISRRSRGWDTEVSPRPTAISASLATPPLQLHVLTAWTSTNS
ncbi:hypothetical protein NDU88_002761 [Pleurodeles waltl]|uniref:Uncharacterized protein n=1 Tax=Pleurodeles waltl TaxID=8319 RepID=A0AAV7M3F6_PLEWA|nr:hypothetical protein NDU88_002761 [Pleurodeles waltl]